MIHVPSTVGERWLGRDFVLIESVAHAGNGVVDLWEESPVRLNSNEPNTDEVIDLLFPGNRLLCCGWTRHRFDTRPRTHWYKLQDLQFIVPNPMAAPLGLTRQYKVSPHALSNTGARRFLIVEFDFDASNSDEEAHLLERLATEGRDVRDLGAALLLNLAEKAPLALVVHSGGKSLHGWFYRADVPAGQNLVVSIYLLVDGYRFGIWLINSSPLSQRGWISSVLEILQRVVGGYIRGQFIMSAIMGVLQGVGMAIIGVPFALFIGALAAIMEFIPMIGTIVVGFVAVVIALTQSWTLALITLGALPLTRVVSPSGPVHRYAAGGSAPWDAVRHAMGDRSYLLLHAGFFTCGFHIAFLVTHLPGEVNLCGLPPAVASFPQPVRAPADDVDGARPDHGRGDRRCVG